MASFSREDVSAAVGDMANCGAVLQEVAATGIVSERVVQAAGLLLIEIAELAGAADPASAENDA